MSRGGAFLVYFSLASPESDTRGGADGISEKSGEPRLDGVKQVT